MKEIKLDVSPHIYSSQDTRRMMKGVIVALVPNIFASLYFFRWKAFFVMLVAVVSCALTEYTIQRIRKKNIELSDHSFLVTALLYAMVLPPALPLWMVFLGGVFAIIFGKEIFGGLGCNIFNPALMARAFLMAAFPVALTTWAAPITLDAVTSATPLGLAKFEHVITPYTPLFIGNVAGSIGETSALALLLGFVYLLYKKIIDYRVPLAYVGTVVVFASVCYIINPVVYAPPLFHVLAGGLLIGAIFMATDPVTSPVTKKGRWVFGAGCGVLTMVIRNWGGLPEGVMYAILLMNAVTPLINRMTRPRRFGAKHGT
ncbi:MAG: RnfABCDGE type electron transport complex subunit D [Candidatus Omnitrophica bacterium]|nr:RnfABCDGE type electron transport complex subunit D [Candidatus Omnitrophota bacterium]